MQKNAPVGIFDSGVGGISVLGTAHRLLPEEDFIYYGDTAHAPYGTKTEQEVVVYARAAANFLLAQGVKALLIACNTATCAAAATLRSEHPDLIIIGMEPALKLAHDRCPQGQILVLATPVSLASRKYQMLYEAYGEHAVSLPCPGLMDFAERGEVDSPALHDYLDRLLSPYLTGGQEPAAVVLGCTHYPFLRRAIKRALPASTLVLDGNEGTVRQLRRRLKEADLLRNDSAHAGEIRFFSSAGDAALPLMKHLLALSD